MKSMSGRGFTRRFALVALAASVLAIVGCSPQEGDEGSPDAAKPKVALIMKSLANEFFVTMAAAAEDHQDKHQADYELIVNGIKNESDLAQQVALVDQMIGVGVNAIVIAPCGLKSTWCRRLIALAKAGFTS